MNRNDGGPAFPQSVAQILGVAANSSEFGLPGMSLRDYFAGQALVGCLAHERDSFVRATKAHGVPIAVAIATLTYEIADAMLAERERTS